MDLPSVYPYVPAIYKSNCRAKQKKILDKKLKKFMQRAVRVLKTLKFSRLINLWIKKNNVYKR